MRRDDIIGPALCAGPRSAKALADAALAALSSAPVAAVRGAEELAAFRSKSALPKVVLASAKAAPTALLRSLALRFKGRLAFATARALLRWLPVGMLRDRIVQPKKTRRPV